MNLKIFFAVGVASLLLVTGCGKKEAAPAPAQASVETIVPEVKEAVAAPVSFKAVLLGNALTEGKKITAPLSAFAPNDVIYAVVETEGKGKAMIKAVWTFHKGDKTAQVSEANQSIEASGPAFTEFNIVKESGWPIGDYKVEIFLNDASVSTANFTVK